MRYHFRDGNLHKPTLTFLLTVLSQDLEFYGVIMKVKLFILFSERKR